MMFLNVFFTVTVCAYFIVPTVLQYRQGVTRRESIALASAQFGVLLLMFAGIVGAAYGLSVWGVL